ncbi:hypothetical protein CFP71_14870 [Amycolatopsis thailandensis]|uniref:Zinc finger CGNR domain-containing protein n=1 Tax=Amycolatopsis thailandensis TaxID=589330 RepID=A0A229SBL7_9PSEU|nr:hypothetical protein CFP71_14870 [Amycolatopsis thailandensis]
MASTLHVAREAISLLNSPRTARIRECEHPDCSRLFCDLSHGGRRRRCGMGTCGTKAKSATYRRRKKERIAALRRMPQEAEGSETGRKIRPNEVMAGTRTSARLTR